MKRTFNFASRNIKELVRDPLGAVFAILLPLFLLFVFRQFDIPNEAYLPENFTPGIIVFAFSFLTLFESTLVSRDRTTALMTRLSVSPMKRAEYVPGYLLSTLPIALLQCLLITAAGVALGLPMRARVLLAIPAALPAAVLFALFGVFIGNIVSDKAAPGVSSVIVQLVCFTSGMYFPKELVGKGFAAVCDLLPFGACLDLIRSAVSGGDVFSAADAAVLAAWLAATLAAAALLRKKSI